jgi:adenine-specific DNA-methyltransferase
MIHMSTSGPEKLKMKSPDMALENVETIAHIFPNVVTEIRDENGEVRKGIDFDLLKQELSGNVCEGREERYEFTWVGKKQSIVEGTLPIQKTLRPCMDESKDWENTKNIYIEGDNLEALKLLQESYLNKVKMIYIDPPYNTGNDFIYNDKFVMDSDDYDAESGGVDDVGNRLIKNGKDRGRYHSDWCSMLYPRLRLAHNLLTEDGVIFISIDNNEVHNLRKMMDEVFGEENFIEEVVWVKRVSPANDSQWYSSDHEFFLVYAKTKANWSPTRTKRTAEHDKYYKNPDNDSRGPWNSAAYTCNKSRSQRPNLYYGIINPNNHEEIFPNENAVWAYSKEIHEENVRNNLLYWGADGCSKSPRKKQFLYDAKDVVPRSFWHFSEVGSTQTATTELRELFEGASLSYPKPVKLIYKMIYQGTNDNDIILDFFSGSATTAHATIQLNADFERKRKFIMIQLPEVVDEKSEAAKAGYATIAEIGKERIRRAGEQIKAEIEEKNRQATIDGEQKTIPDIGFRVFKIDDTNMKDVYYSAAEYSQETIEGLVDNVRPDRTDLDLLYQIVIDWGLPLDLPHEIAEIDGFHIHIVDRNALVACFDANIPESVMRKIAEKKPLRAVFRDGSFRSSPGKLNIEGIFKMIAPDTTLRVI